MATDPAGDGRRHGEHYQHCHHNAVEGLVSILDAKGQHSAGLKRMCRSLCFLLCMLLFCAALAFAGPFSEVPRQHWSYDAVDRLRTLGLVEADVSGFYRLGYDVSKYELALCVDSAISIMDRVVGASPVEQKDSKTSVRMVNLPQLIAAYNKARPAQAISAADSALLQRLAGFVQEELLGMGYVLTTPLTLSAIPRTAAPQNEPLGMQIATVGSGTLSLWPTVTDFSARNSLTATGSGIFSEENKYELYPLGLGLSLDFGDVHVMAGKSASAGTADGTVGSTTALGFNVRLPKMEIKVGYASQAAQESAAKTAASGRRIASADLEYIIAPASKAVAAVAVTANEEERTTTTGFGLQFHQQDATVTLGYRLIDLSAVQAGEEPEVRNNVATAEFSIRF